MFNSGIMSLAQSYTSDSRPVKESQSGVPGLEVPIETSETAWAPTRQGGCSMQAACDMLTLINDWYQFHY